MGRRIMAPVLAAVAVLLLLAVATVGPGRLSGPLRSFRDDTAGASRTGANGRGRGLSEAERSALRAAADVDPLAIRRTVDSLSALASRVPGTAGHRRAFAFVRESFAALGYTTFVDTFDVTVPVDHGGRLVLGERAIPVHAFWPNHVQPPVLPEGGLSAPIVYGGDGSLAALRGLEVDGAVVLLDFDCGRNWLHVRALGAEAILFYDDGTVSRAEAERKVEQRVPADVPRYWVAREDAEALKAASGRIVHLDARMTWEEVEAWNVIAAVPRVADRLFGTRSGGDPDLVLAGSYYDAVSVVPAVAPGAESAAGLAATLELARVLRDRPAEHDLAFVVTGAHFQALRGAMDFVYRHARGSRRNPIVIPEARKIDFDLFLGIDLSSEGDRVVVLPHGTINNFEYRSHSTVLATLRRPAERLAERAEALFGPDRLFQAVGTSGRSWKDYMGTDLALDHEAIQIVGRRGMTLATAWASRIRVDTPLDVAVDVDIDAITAQARTIAGALAAVAREPGFATPPEIRPEDRGHALSGQALRYDRKVDFALPRTPVSGALVAYRPRGTHEDRAGVRTLVLDTATEGPTYPTAFGTGPDFASQVIVSKTGRYRFDLLFNDFFSGRSRIRLLAYGFDERGRIVYAPDIPSEGDFATDIEPGSAENESSIILFPTRTQTLIETIDPTYLNPLSQVSLLTAGDTSPLEYGYAPRKNRRDVRSPVSDVTVTYAPYSEERGRIEPLKILMASDLFGQKLLLLNTPRRLFDEPVGMWEIDGDVEADSRGRGFGPGLIERPDYQAALDTWVLDDVRLKRLRQYGIRNGTVERLHAEAREALLEAERALDRLDYERFTAASRRAWSLEARAYPEVMGTARDTVQGIVFYFVLLLPCSLFFERLLIGATSVNGRLFGFAGFFVAFFLALRWVHPAFKLTSSPYIVFLAFIILALGVAAAVIIVSKFGRETLRLRQQTTGVIEDDVGRGSVTWTAVSLGISNLRKRPLRTGLTIVTLTLLTFTALSLTSLKSSIVSFKLPRDTAPSYRGFQVRDREWGRLDRPVHDFVRSAFGEAAVAPRAWLATKILGTRAYYDFERLDARAPDSFVNALIGFTPEETRVTGVDRFLIAGRWFADRSEPACILPDDVASIVGIGTADVGTARIRILGQPLTVVGILDTDAYHAFHDLDGEPMTPIRVEFERESSEGDYRVDATAEAAQDIEYRAHIETANTMLLPYDRVLDLGGYTYSIGVGDFGARSITDAVEAFIRRISITVFVGDGDRVVAYSSIGAIGLSGAANLFLPMLLAALIVLNTMLGAVYERTQEIGVYTAVGLAPNHVGALFLAEAGVYATVAAVLGYLIGQTAVVVLAGFGGTLGGLEVNYSSLAVVYVTLVVMATTFLSTLYPARQASNLAVPDVTRQWAFPDANGDTLVFDFPFTVGTADVLSLTTYLVRVFQSYEEGTATAFEVDRVDFRDREIPGHDLRQYEVDMQAWLPPYDFGISQTVTMTASPSDEAHDLYTIELALTRLSGDFTLWQHANRAFLNAIRKQFLVWRTASEEEKRRYADEGREMLGTSYRTDNRRILY